MSGRQAGSALNAEVAEKVMGWVWRRSRNSGRRCLYDPARIPEWMDQPADGTERLVHDWNDMTFGDFSTDISAAWAVVEKLTGFVSKREHPWWSVAVFHAQSGQTGCRVYACPPGHSIFDAGNPYALSGSDPRVIAERVAGSAPHAICLAALAAVASTPAPRTSAE